MQTTTKTKLRFAHLADCHVGSWREPKMRELNILAFSSSIDKIIRINSEETSDKKIDFVLISGDLFNTAIPSIDALKEVTEKLKLLHDAGITVYGIGGSHDYSAAGKSMLDVLEKAHLFCNVMKGEITEDNKLRLSLTKDKSGANITGIIGKRGTLEKGYYDALDYNHLSKLISQKQDGAFSTNIFLFHSTISEYKPEYLTEVESIPLSILPRNFDYYAGGHVHYRYIKKENGFGTIAFPGPIFPNNFKELVELKDGSFIIVDIDLITKEVNTEYIYLENKILFLEFKSLNETPQEIFSRVKSKLFSSDIEGKILLLKLEGVLSTGTLSEINFNDLNSIAIEKGAVCIIRNTAQLISSEFQEISSSISDISEVEKILIDEHISQSLLKSKNLTDLDTDQQKALLLNLIEKLHSDKQDGETTSDFEERVIKEFNSLT